MGLIGIVGKIGAGKDLVGGLIQYLLWHKAVEEKGASMHLSIKDFIDGKGYTVSRNVGGWEIKKFADKLKEILCIMIGCTRSQLEDREFKEKELGEEWWYVELKGNGVKKLLTVQEYKEHIKGTTYLYKESDIVKPTPRLFLQLLGTDCGRDIIHPNVWVNALMSEYKVSDYSTGQTCCLGLTNSDKDIRYPNWIITDVRFPNEVKAIKDRKGIVIRKLGKDSETGTHESETALDNTVVDYEIPYCEDIYALKIIVQGILVKEGIL